LYALGVEQGVINERSIFHNTPETYRLASGKLWTPSNYNGKHDGKALSLADAVAASVNVVAVQVLNQLSPQELIRVSRSLGVRGHMAPNLTLALGSAEVTPLEVTNAIATFPSMGRFEQSVLIRTVRLPDGSNVDLEEIWRQIQCQSSKTPDCHRERVVFQERTAQTVVRLMKQVVVRGTARKLKALKRSAAGKTGTTNQGRTLWFMGYTPNYTVGVMVGNDDRRPIKKGTGGRFAAPIWLDFMSQFLKGRAPNDFGPWAASPPPTASQLGAPPKTLPPGARVHEVEAVPKDVDSSGAVQPEGEGGIKIAPPSDLDMDP